MFRYFLAFVRLEKGNAGTDVSGERGWRVADDGALYLRSLTLSRECVEQSAVSCDSVLDMLRTVTRPQCGKRRCSTCRHRVWGASGTQPPKRCGYHSSWWEDRLTSLAMYTFALTGTPLPLRQAMMFTSASESVAACPNELPAPTRPFTSEPMHPDTSAAAPQGRRMKVSAPFMVRFGCPSVREQRIVMPASDRHRQVMSNTARLASGLRPPTYEAA